VRKLAIAVAIALGLVGLFTVGLFALFAIGLTQWSSSK
jgi:hypothetical protein